MDYPYRYMDDETLKKYELSWDLRLMIVGNTEDGRAYTVHAGHYEHPLKDRWINLLVGMRDDLRGKGELFFTTVVGMDRENSPKLAAEETGKAIRNMFKRKNRISERDLKSKIEEAVKSHFLESFNP